MNVSSCVEVLTFSKKDTVILCDVGLCFSLASPPSCLSKIYATLSRGRTNACSRLAIILNVNLTFWCF